MRFWAVVAAASSATTLSEMVQVLWGSMLSRAKEERPSTRASPEVGSKFATGETIVVSPRFSKVTSMSASWPGAGTLELV